MKWTISRGRMKKIIIGGVIFFVVFTLFGFFALPPIIKSLLTQKLSEALHREVTIEQIKINPYALSVTLRGFLVKERGSAEKFVSFDELYVNLQSISAIKLAPVIKEISLKQPYINLKRIDETAYNFSDLIENKEPKPAEKPAEKSKPFRFSLNNIKIENGSIDFWDGPKQTKHTIKELNISVPTLSNIQTQIETFVQPSFSAKINETPYAIQGKTKPFADSRETNFDIDIKDLDIPYYLAYLPMKLNFTIASAYLSTQIKLAFIQYKDKESTLVVTGNVSLKKLALDDEKKNPLFKLPLMEIGIAPSEPLKKVFHLSKVSIQSPELNVVRNQAGVLNIESRFPRVEERIGEIKKGETAPTTVDADEIELKGGKVYFSDLSRKKPFKTVLSPIELKVDHFSNQKEKKTAYALSITSEARENINLQGELSLEPLSAEGGLEIKAVPLKKYSPYYQDQILFNLEDGRLDFSTRYRYAKAEKEPEISLSGLSVILNALRLKRPEEKEDFLKIPALSIKDTLVDVTRKRATLGSFSTDKGTLILNRFKNGELDLQKLFPPPPPKEETPAPDKEKGKEIEKPWTVAINRMSVDQYTVKMGDQNPSQPTTLTGERIAIRGENISTAKNAQGKLSLSLLLDQTTALSTKNTVSLDPLRIDGSLELKNIVLNKYSPYYQENILFNIEEGTLDVYTNYQYSKTEKDTVTRLSGLSLALKTLRLKKKNEPEDFLNIPLFTIQNTEMDLNRRELSIGNLSTQGGALLVQKLKDGKLNLQTLFPEPAKSEKKPEEEKPVQEKAATDGKPWVVKLGNINVDQYRVGVKDLTPEEPVTIDAEAIQLKADNLSTAKNSKGNASLSLVLNKTGTVSVSGPVGIDPLLADLTLNLKEIDLRLYQPYFTDKVKITLTDGSISTTGRLQVKDEEGKGVQIVYKGESALNNFATIDKASSEDFLKWKSIVFSNMDIGVNPLYVNIEGVALTDFYSRLIINPKGVINLQEIMAEKKDATDKGSKEKPAQKPDQKKPGASATEPPMKIKIDNVTFQGGQINYSDYFIKPNVTVNMVEVGGKITGLSSEEITQADVDLRGKFGQQSSPVEITGRINPLKKDLFLDMKVSFKDIELSPMSPYSGKYTGYAIEKGKLFLDLKYHIENRKLDAQNRIFLDQFTFGEKVDSPDATKLPVKLAVSLLKNRKGEIDLNIPVSGNLDDPKFSIFGIIIKVLLNLLVKAATSPFALLGSAFGGGEQLDALDFDYGSSEIKGESATKLNTLAKALQDKTSIKMDIEGYADPEKDKEALRQVFFQRKLKAQKLKEILKKGEPAVPVDEVKIEPAEYEKLLKLAYKEEKFPKPKNALGMAKDIPAPEMEKLMLTYTEVKEEDLRLLASQRAMKVKEGIIKAGQVEPERIFIVGPKTLAPPKKEKLKDSRVELKLK
jgi:uncharacterized protein involved in outer membrane biogenesis